MRRWTPPNIVATWPDSPVDSTEAIRKANRKRYERQMARKAGQEADRKTLAKERKYKSLLQKGKRMQERIKAQQRKSYTAKREALRQGIVYEKGVPIEQKSTIAPTGKLTSQEYDAYERQRIRTAAQSDPSSGMPAITPMRDTDAWVESVVAREEQHQQMLEAQDDRASEERRANRAAYEEEQEKQELIARKQARAAGQEADRQILAQERQAQMDADASFLTQQQDVERLKQEYAKRQSERYARNMEIFDERFAARQAAREADRADLWRTEEHEAHAVKAPEGTTAVTYADQQQQYHLKPTKPKYGWFWRNKSIPSYGFDYDWLKKKDPKEFPYLGRDVFPFEFKDGYWSDEYRYDTAVIRNNESLKKATEAQDRYQVNLGERDVLKKEIASQKNKVDVMTADINEYNDTLSTYELSEKIQARNSLRRDLEAKETALRVLEKDLSRDRKVMHDVRDKMATFFVNDGPLTSETRALGYSLGAFLLGGVVIAKALEVAVDWQAFSTSRTMTPLEGVWGA